MAAPFAALEARINAAVVSHLANATADFGGGVTVDGEFSGEYSEAGGISGSSPSIRCDSAAVAFAVQGAFLTIAAVSYTITSLEPDGTGMTFLRLNRA